MRITQIQRPAHTIIGSTVELDTRMEQTAQGIRQRHAGRI